MNKFFLLVSILSLFLVPTLYGNSNDTSPEAGEKVLIFDGLHDESTVYVDGIDVTETIIDGQMPISTGSHEVVVTEPEFVTITKEVFVREDRPSCTVYLSYEKDNSKFTDSFKPIAIGLVVPGSILAAGGITLVTVALARFYYLLDTDTFYDQKYSYFLSTRNMYFSLLISGIVIGSIGAVFCTISIPLFVIKKPRSSFKKGKKDTASKASGRENTVSLFVAGGSDPLIGFKITL